MRISKQLNVEELWEDQDSNIKEGITRSVLKSMVLRDQPILDQIQDEIFRMRLDSRCFLSGPPGTGKTTTLIKRLGQKTDIFVEKEFEQENRLADEVERDTNIPHEKSWYLFSPTELLKQYVKEAAAREALPATDQEMFTWNQFSRMIARDELNLLNFGERKSRFVFDDQTVGILEASIDLIAWFNDFREYFKSENEADLENNVKQLSKHGQRSLQDLGKKFLQGLERF